MKTRNIILIGIVVVISAAMVTLKVLPDSKSYVKENNGVYQHIVMESDDVQLELRRLMIDSYQMSLEYAVTKDGEFLDGYEVKLNMPDVYYEPLKLTEDNNNVWQEHQVSVVNDLLNMDQTKLGATIEKDGKTIKFVAIDLDLSNYNIMFMGDVEINKTIMLDQCSVNIIKMRYAENTLELYYEVINTEDSFVSYLFLPLYNDAGTRYKSNNKHWGSNSSVIVSEYHIDEAFNNSDTIKIEAHQANVTNVLETHEFSYEDISFEYEGYQYALNVTSTEKYQVNFELVCESEEMPAYPELVYKTSQGWDQLSSESDNAGFQLSSAFIPEFLIEGDADSKLAAQNIVNFFEEHYNETFDVEVIQAVLPTILNKDVFVYIKSDGSLMKSLDQYVWGSDKILEIGISSPNDVNIITESIEVEIK